MKSLALLAIATTLFLASPSLPADTNVVVEPHSNVSEASASAAQTNTAPPYVTHSPDGYCEISIDTSGAPELKEWAEQTLAPVLAEWYPKLVASLPSEGYEPPKKFSIVIKPGEGVAATGGTRVSANSRWLKNKEGVMNAEAVGAILHEEVHVIQQYGRARRQHPDAPRPPGWLVEGIADYLRWFKFEPQSHGADTIWMRTRRNLAQLRYDGSYRVTANFLDWVTEKYDPQIVRKLNASLREGRYTPDLWKEGTGHALEDLGSEWKTDLTAKVQAPAAQ